MYTVTMEATELLKASDRNGNPLYLFAVDDDKLIVHVLMWDSELQWYSVLCKMATADDIGYVTEYAPQ